MEVVGGTEIRSLNLVESESSNILIQDPQVRSPRRRCEEMEERLRRDMGVGQGPLSEEDVEVPWVSEELVKSLEQ